MQESVKHKLLESKRICREQIPVIRAAQSPQVLHQALRKYVYAKYLLDDDREDGIAELTKSSIARAIKLDKRLMEDVDMAAECTGSTSAMRKKVLLLMAMQKDFGVQLDPVQASDAETLAELAQLIYDELSR